MTVSYMMQFHKTVITESEITTLQTRCHGVLFTHSANNIFPKLDATLCRFLSTHHRWVGRSHVCLHLTRLNCDYWRQMKLSSQMNRYHLATRVSISVCTDQPLPRRVRTRRIRSRSAKWLALLSPPNYVFFALDKMHFIYISVMCMNFPCDHT